jgi:transcriptional regulator with PAS, ATPase and Fis domain
MGYNLEDYFDDIDNKEITNRYLECEKNSLISRESVPALDIMKKIMKSAVETGTPFIFFRDTVNKAKKIGKTNSTILISAETGTGKELFAQSIHNVSERRDGPFVAINCAALPENLLESELFGYEDGAFTGAKKEGKQGKFEMANGGSLFLDEINQLSMVAQPKLLRVLQEKEIEKIGGKESIPVDVRLIVATNNSLEKMISERKFRNDLFYRLNVINIKVPPLRERKEDIPLHVDNIINKLNFQMGLNIQGADPEVIERFMEYDWPGNIRELQNVVERGMNIALTGQLQWHHFGDYFNNKFLRNSTIIRKNDELQLRQAKKDLEKNIILERLVKNSYNKTQCARELGISRTLLYKKMRQYGIM